MASQHLALCRPGHESKRTSVRSDQRLVPTQIRHLLGKKPL